LTAKWTMALVTLLAALFALVAACGDDDDESSNGGGATEESPSAEGAADQLCNDLEALDEAVFNFQALNETNTVDEVTAARDDVREALDDVKTSAADVPEARVEDLDAAYEGLDEAVASVEGGQTLAEVQADLQDAAVDVLLARAEFGDQVNCPAPATSPARSGTSPTRTATP
jgi:hypothetical protein